MSKKLIVYAAGSLRTALTEIFHQFTHLYGIPIHAQFAPAGLLREAIEAGEPVDIYASANCEHPSRLVEIGLAQRVIPFIQNKLCIVMKNTPELVDRNIIDALLDPRWRLGISTPHADPGGDYAIMLFDKIEKLRPGSLAILTAKAQSLVGGTALNLLPNHRHAATYFINEGIVDLFVGYASSANSLENQPMLVVKTLPDTLSITAHYGLTLLNGASPDAPQLVDFILSQQGIAMLVNHGFTTNS